MRSWGVVLGSLMAVGAFGAPDFWEAKEFPGWSQAEVYRMLNKSPWARGLEISFYSLRTVRRGSGINASDGRGYEGGRGGPGPPPTSIRRPRRERGRPKPLKLMIRWYSALPIKQALALADYDGELSEDVRSLLLREETHFVVGISGWPERMFHSGRRLRAQAHQIKEQSFIRFRGLEPIPADQVHIAKDLAKKLDAKTGRAGVECWLTFRRPPGPPVGLEGKNVELVTRFHRVSIKRKFGLKSMVYKDRLEL